MKERGIDLGEQESKRLEDLPDGVAWEAVVTMGCGDACPHLPSRTRLDWDLPDPKTMGDDEFRRTRDRIESLVADLVALVAPIGIARGETRDR